MMTQREKHITHNPSLPKVYIQARDLLRRPKMPENQKGDFEFGTPCGCPDDPGGWREEQSFRLWGHKDECPFSLPREEAQHDELWKELVALSRVCEKYNFDCLVCPVPKYERNVNAKMVKIKTKRRGRYISDTVIWTCPNGHTSPYYRGDAFLYYGNHNLCSVCGEKMKTEEKP